MPIRSTTLLLVAGVAAPMFGGTAEAGGFWFHHGHGSSNVVVVQPTAVPVVTVVPVAASQVQTVSTGYMVTGGIPGVRLVPASNGYTTVPVGTTTSYVLVPQGGTTTAGPTVAPAAGGYGLGAAALSGVPSDQDYQILMAGFGGSLQKLQDLEKKLADALTKLSGQAGLSRDDIATYLKGVAHQYLNQTGFGFVLDPVIDGIITRLINKVIQGNPVTPAPPGPSPTQPGTSPTPGGVSVPSGGFTFNVTGQITLTPAQNGGSGSNGGTTPPPAPQPAPKDLTKDEPGLNVAPPGR